MNPIDEFKKECHDRIASYQNDGALKNSAHQFLKESLRAKYSYNFTWMGRPVIQYPQDLIALQELIMQIKPDCIIETGIAHGGSILFSSSMLELLGGDRIVIGIDIDIRSHNRVAIQEHPMFKRVKMIEGPSTDQKVIAEVKAIASNYKTIMVILDSDHTHSHVLEELQAYAPLVTAGSYCVVFDGIIEDMPQDFYADRKWGPGNNPKTAVIEFLKEATNFKIDFELEQKLIVTAAPSGYLKRIS